MLLACLTAVLALASGADAKPPQRGFLSAATKREVYKNPYIRPRANGYTAKSDPYGYVKALGLSLKFWEIQRSGKIKAPGAQDRIGWRENQLMGDGKDIGANLEGGHYEAGSSRPPRLALSDQLHLLVRMYVQAVETALQHRTGQAPCYDDCA
jgi:Glycosyl hydrolase family 9